VSVVTEVLRRAQRVCCHAVESAIYRIGITATILSHSHLPAVAKCREAAGDAFGSEAPRDTAPVSPECSSVLLKPKASPARSAAPSNDPARVPSSVAANGFRLELSLPRRSIARSHSPPRHRSAHRAACCGQFVHGRSAAIATGSASALQRTKKSRTGRGRSRAAHRSAVA
jgi:hypothetical protein